MIAPTIAGTDGAVAATSCRLSPDLSRLAFWVASASPRGLFVGRTEHEAEMGRLAERIWSSEVENLSDLAWSGDGQYLAFMLSSGPPPGRLGIGVLRLADRQFTELAGHAFAWAGSGATLLIADPAGSRLYLKDLELGVEHRISAIADDGDPHFPPVISVSPDQRRLAWVTRRVRENVTQVHLAQHDGRTWQASPLSELPGVGLRIFPFWSADSRGLALYVIDLEQHHSAIIAVPEGEGEGDILYTSDSIDAAITPAPHPDGRLIAFVRAHPKKGASTLVENRLVLLDPVEHSVASLTSDAQIIGNLRWLDQETLLVEGGPAVWTVRLRATVEAAAADEPAAAPEAQAYVRTVVRDVEPGFTFVCEIPAGWQRVPLPSDPVDLADPRVMRPLCFFTPTYAAIVFTVATRPLIPGATAAESLAFHCRAQGLSIEPVREVILPCGRAAQTTATQRAGDDLMKMRLVMIEDGGRLFSLSAIAPAALWDAVKPTLDHIIESFALLDPQSATTSLPE